MKDQEDIGIEIFKLCKKLWPHNRSITGKGTLKTLCELKKIIPDIEIKSFNSGTKVFDWEIPDEWNINEAFIITPDGKKICDFKKNNLYVVNYSTSVECEISLKELKKNLYSIPERPDAIPYVTSYYKRRWGFCIEHNLLRKLKEGKYKIKIDSSLNKGKLNYGELILPGIKKEEILLSTYICHPSMANNELSGPTVTTFLAKWLLKLKDRKYTYRILFIPETIGSIAYLSRNYKKLKKLTKAGFNITCVGDNRAYSYLPSRDGNTLSDYVAKHVLKWIDKNYKVYSWLERGSDERQYCSPGIDLPIASIMRTKYGCYPEYHSSEDDLVKVVNPEGLKGGFLAIKKALQVIENNYKPLNQNLCEPQLGKRNLYPNITRRSVDQESRTLLNILSFCDGNNSILDISEKLNKPFWVIYEKSILLKKEKLIN